MLTALYPWSGWLGVEHDAEVAGSARSGSWQSADVETAQLGSKSSLPVYIVRVYRSEICKVRS